MRAMLDTCIVIDFENYHQDLPEGELGLSAMAFAELCTGTTTIPPGTKRDARVERLQWARTFFEPLPFDHDAAVVYGRMAAALRRIGRNERSRTVDLMIAATAAASDVPLYTNNADDFVGLENLVDIIVI
jgi:toxin FitB